MTNPKIIGITGPIASGKSTVSGLLTTLISDTLLLDADAIVHFIYDSNTTLANSLATALKTSDFITEDQTVDRKKLGQHIKNNPNALKRVEALVHPVLHQIIHQEIATSAPETTILLDVPLLLTSPLKNICDTILYCDCPEQVRRERLTERHQMSTTLADTLIAKQKYSIEAHKDEAHIIIHTDGDLTTLVTSLKQQLNLPFSD